MNRYGIVVGAACLTLLLGAAAARTAEPDGSGSTPLKPLEKKEQPAGQSSLPGGLRVVPDSLLALMKPPAARPYEVRTKERSAYGMPTVEPDSTKNYTMMVMKPDPSMDYKINIMPRALQPKTMSGTAPKGLPEDTPAPAEEPRDNVVPKK